MKRIGLLFLVFICIIFFADAQWVTTSGPYGGDVRSLVCNNQDHFFDGTKNVGIFQSEDNGEYWIQVNNGLTTTDITALVFDYDGNLYAGTFPVWGEGGGVCRSTDNGNSWTELNDGLTNLEVSFLFGDYINLLYVGTSNGLFIYNYDLFSCLSESMQRHADSPVKFCFSN